MLRKCFSCLWKLWCPWLPQIVRHLVFRCATLVSVLLGDKTHWKRTQGDSPGLGKIGTEWSCWLTPLTPHSYGTSLYTFSGSKKYRRRVDALAGPLQDHCVSEKLCFSWSPGSPTQTTTNPRPGVRILYQWDEIKPKKQTFGSSTPTACRGMLEANLRGDRQKFSNLVFTLNTTQ